MCACTCKSPLHMRLNARVFFYFINIRWIRGLFLSVARVNGDFAQNTTIHLYSVCMWISAFHLYMQYIIMRGYFFQNSISGLRRRRSLISEGAQKNISRVYTLPSSVCIRGVIFRKYFIWSVFWGCRNSLKLLYTTTCFCIYRCIPSLFIRVLGPYLIFCCCNIWSI